MRWRASWPRRHHGGAAVRRRRPTSNVLRGSVVDHLVWAEIDQVVLLLVIVVILYAIDRRSATPRA